MLTDDELAVMYGKAYMATDSQGASIPHFGRLVEAATLATVTPLVQQMLDAMVMEGSARYEPQMAAEDAARAFLSGATKESTDAL